MCLVALVFLGIRLLFFGVCSFLYVPDVNNIKSWAEFKLVWPLFEWMVSMVGVIGLILLNFSVARAPAEGWSSAYIIVYLMHSLIFIASFFAIEMKFAPNPLLPKEIYNVRLLLVFLLMTFGWGSFRIWHYIFLEINAWIKRI